MRAELFNRQEILFVQEYILLAPVPHTFQVAIGTCSLYCRNMQVIPYLVMRVEILGASDGDDIILSGSSGGPGFGVEG